MFCFRLALSGFYFDFEGRRGPIWSSFLARSLSELVNVGFREATVRLLGGSLKDFVLTAAREPIQS